jgi:hypothetical protein
MNRHNFEIAIDGPRNQNSLRQRRIATRRSEEVEPKRWRWEMKKLIAILALCIASTAAMAQTAPQPMAGSQRMERMEQQLQARFAAANTTHDGKLTLAQAQAGMPRIAQYFEQIDTQKQGYVTLAQIEQFVAQRAGSH